MISTTAPGFGIKTVTAKGGAGFGRFMRHLATGTYLLLAALAPVPAAAQSQFAPAVRVDDEVITTYQMVQRERFLTLLRAPGDVRTMARDQLINELLQMREAKAADIAADADAVKKGMEEFAQRGNLTADQFLQLLGQGGVDASTFRDFVTAGVSWRDYVRSTLMPRINLSDLEIDTAMARVVPDPGLRFLLSEIVLPASDPATRKASLARAKRLAGLDEKGFADAAMRFSIGASRNNKGKMNWLDVTALPPGVGAAVRGLKPGQISRIIESDQKIRLYFVRDREEVSSAKPATQVDYAALLLPGGASKANLDEVARIRARVTSCDDLYPIARGLAPEQFSRETLPEAQVPAAYAGEIAKLDAGEISSAVVSQNGAMTVLMLCSRGNVLPRSTTRDMVATQLKTQRVAAQAQMLLDQLRANARIEILR